MGTNAVLQKALAQYQGQKGKLKRNLGDEGMRMLWLMCGGSPTEMAEFLGYGSISGAPAMSRECGRLDLPTQKRNWATSGDETFEGGLSVNDWREHYRKETGKREKACVYDWELPKGAEWGVLVGISDLHLGPPEMDYGRWERLRDWIAENPHVRWIGLGDYLDVATVQSPTGKQILPYSTAKELLADDLAPIASQCIGLCHGNHEARIARATKCDENPIAQIARALHVHYFGSDGFLRINITKAGSKQAQSYDGRVHHGWGGARTEGGKVNKLKEVFATTDVDLIMMGHVHALIAAEFLRAGIDDDGYVTTHGIPTTYTGSFLKWESGSYGREGGYAPAALGAATMHCYVDRHSVHVRQ